MLKNYNEIIESVDLMNKHIKDNGAMWRDNNRDTLATFYIVKYGKLPPVNARYKMFNNISSDEDLILVENLQEYCVKCHIVEKVKNDVKSVIRTNKFTFYEFPCKHINYARRKVDTSILHAIKEKLSMSLHQGITKANLRKFFEDIDLKQLPMDFDEFDNILREIEDDSSPAVNIRVIKPLIASIDTVLQLQRNVHPFEMLRDTPGKKNIAKEFLTIVSLSKEDILSIKMVKDALATHGNKRIKNNIIQEFIDTRDCAALANKLNC